MNSKLIKTLSVICLVLVSIIALEWIYGTRAQKKLLSSSNSPEKQTLPDQMPVIGLNLQTEESYTDLVNRPLFIEGRRPVTDTNQGQATGGTSNFDWLLSGVYTSKQGSMALLTRTTPDPAAKNSEQYRKIITGANVDGWKVAEINTDAIVLTQGVTEKKLLLRKVKAKQPQEQNNPNTPHRPTPEAPEPQTEPEPNQ
ncbi:MAG: hypothetical protein Q8N30_13975 [Methylococcales bacterium]|nr:hypothetical protein [Methylococcales bacterium]